MKRRWRRNEAQTDSEANGKLDQLLHTETQLEAMIDQAKREANDMVTAASESATARVRDFEEQLEQERLDLRLRIDREADDAIRVIQVGAQQECSRLEQLDEDSIDRLARQVLDHLVAGPHPPEEP